MQGKNYAEDAFDITFNENSGLHIYLGSENSEKEFHQAELDMSQTFTLLEEIIRGMNSSQLASVDLMLRKEVGKR